MNDLVFFLSPQNWNGLTEYRQIYIFLLTADVTADVTVQVHQVQMEGVVRGIQADMTKLSKSHSHTANTVSKLLDKSRKLSVTMKEVIYNLTRICVSII